jgi:thiamine-phosphate pyrophosphorylase
MDSKTDITKKQSLGRRSLPRGLYAITDSDLLSRSQLPAAVREALLGGARTIQYREKSADRERRLEEALIIRELCREFGATFIVNDDVALAISTQADGVHIGLEDGRCRDVRRRAGDEPLIGVSCYDSLERAVEAQNAGADYVAFGSAYASATKPNAVRATLSLYRDAIARLEIAVVAIGGIDSTNGQILVDAGCRSLAVIRSLFGAPDIRRQALAFAALFGQDAD